MLLFATEVLHAQNVRINEIMSSNQSSLADERGKFPDWIEFYNAGTSNVNLAGWRLTDSRSNPNKWIFPDRILEAGKYLVVFASGNDNEGDTLHTNFSIDKDGEYLALISNAGDIVSKFDPLPTIQTDNSYAWKDDVFVMTTEPTPGKQNIFSDPVILPTPSFGISPGYFDNEFLLSMESEVSGAEIYYTLNGDEPSKSANAYLAPIRISTTTIVRAVCYSEDDVSNTITGSYIFLDDVINQPAKPVGFPSMWGPYVEGTGNAIGDYEMDPEITLDAAYKDKMIDALKALPMLSLVTTRDNLWSSTLDEVKGGIYYYTGAPGDERGKGWERPASIEYFDKDGNLQFQANCGVRIHGQHSRRAEKTPKHSFRVNFKSEYGPSKLKYPFFADSDVKSFNSLVLKTPFGNSVTHHGHSQRIVSQWTRDVWTKNTQLAMGQLSTHMIPIHLYIDGLYWGIYFINERPDEDFLESYMGGSPDDYDIIRDYTEVDAGTIDAWESMMSLVRTDMSNNANYYKVIGKNPDGSDNPDFPAYIDPENLADYMLINMYGGNTDWDHKNWISGYKRTDKEQGFKFICWDSEMVLGNLNQNVTSENNQNCPSEIFQRLMANNEFKKVFESRVQLHCKNNGALSPAGAGGRFDSLTKIIEVAVIAEYARWGDYRRDVHQYSSGPYQFYTPADFEAQRSYLLGTYFPKRTDIFVNQAIQNGFFPKILAPELAINDVAKSGSYYLFNDNDQLSLSGSGTIYYTINGADPRDGQVANVETRSLLSLGSNWKYIENISDYPSGWSSIEFDDTGWQSGEAQLGYGDGDEKTSISYGGNSSQKIPTYLFRTQVAVEDIAGLQNYSIGIIADDGAIVYVNGVEAFRANMNSGIVNFNDYASGTVQNENNVVTYVVSKSLFKSVVNVIAVEVHQASGTSSDMSFDLSVDYLIETGGTQSALKVYTGAIPLNNSGILRSRSNENGDWGELLQMSLIKKQDRSGLKLTEINYNPTPDESNSETGYEFVELKNMSNETLDMGGVKFQSGISYTFPLGYTLDTGKFVVLAADQVKFKSRYGFEPDGTYSGQLSNSGERLKLTDFEGTSLIDVTYDDNDPWPTKADGKGYSLVPVDALASDPKQASYWRASGKVNGSPGQDDEYIPQPIINNLGNNDILIYPNPTRNLLIIQKVPKGSSVEMFDLSGQIQFESTGDGMEALKIDVSRWKRGVYILKVLNRDGSMLNQKIIIQ